MKTVEEKRKFMRFNASIGMTYRAPEKVLEGFSVTKDLSREGIRFPVNKRLAAGTLIELGLIIPGDSIPIFATGEVAWVKKVGRTGKGNFDIGVRLTEINSFDKSRILEYAYEQWRQTIMKSR